MTEEDALSVFGLVSRGELEALAGAILTGDAATILQAVDRFDSAGKNMRRLSAELMAHFRNLIVFQTLGAKASGLEATPDQVKTLSEQAKLCPSARIFKVTDLLADMEDKLRYVLSVRTFIEMTLLKASRVATVATIEELLKAVRELKASGGGGEIKALNGTNALNGSNAPNGSNGSNSLNGLNALNGSNGSNGPNGTDGLKGPNALKGLNGSSDSSPSGNSAPPPLSSARRREILDDPKLNGLLSTLGGQVADIK